MKKVNYSPQKLAIVATSMVMIYFISGIASIAQSAELVKAEPIVPAELVQAAKESLKQSFTTIAISNEFMKNDENSLIANQKDSSRQETSINLDKTLLIGE